MNVPLIDLKAQYQTIKDEIHEAIDGVLERQKFILDVEGNALEEETARFTHSRFAIGCASGTDAILLSLLALGIGEGDEVITTAYSFFSTAGMIAWIKAKPIFVDIDPSTFNLRTDQVAKKITPKTKAIIAVHLFGQCCRMEELTGLGIPVIEDACQSIGATRNGTRAGAMGITGCFSYFPTKNLGGYGDGGMITTSNEDIAWRLQQLRTHGQSNQYYHQLLGTNSRLDELQAAVLRVKFKYLERWNRMRNEHASIYHEALQGLPLQLPRVDTGNDSIYHQFVIQTEVRDRLRSHLTDRGIGSAVYYPAPIPHQPCFAHLGHRQGEFPHAELCSMQSLALPIYPELTREQQQTVIDAIRGFYE